MNIHLQNKLHMQVIEYLPFTCILFPPENIPFQLSSGCVLVSSSGKNKNKYSNGKFSVRIDWNFQSVLPSSYKSK
jgi:hypothetical protein